MKIGLIDVDGHNFPNLALMKLSAYHKAKGDEVDWYSIFDEHYDIVYMAKVFTHTEDYNQVIPNADKISQWLMDNRKRGLLCFGNCGRGKTLITQRIFPTLLSHYHRKYLNTVTAVELNDIYDDISRCKLISVDDVGTEPESVIYGERHWRFSELVDAAERDQKLLIVSTNLTLDELRQRYGERTFDRLRAITTTVCFSGPSLRK